MKKGFTLVELLAVIIILGVLSLLIVPKVINTLNDSEEKTNMASAEGLLKAAEFKYQDNEINGISESILVDYTNNINTDVLDFNGKKPEKGKANIRSNGKIAFAVKIGEYCYYKSYNEREITSTPYNEETCDNNTSIIQNYEIPETVISGDGLYESTTEPGRLIYRGTNPNNWIWLDEHGDKIRNNDELYRIISYEKDGTIKVVREKAPGSKEWDVINNRTNSNNSYCNNSETGCNVWGNGSNTLHNGEILGNNFHYIYYDNASPTTLTNGISGTVTDDSTINKYLNETWLNALSGAVSNYIDNHQWNVGGIHYTEAGTHSGSMTLLIEDDKGIIKEKEEEKQLNWIGKVGLLNITEFAEASTNPQCSSVYSNYGDGRGCPCKIGNWMLYNKSNDEWTITPFTSDNTGVMTVEDTGDFYPTGSYDYNEFRPAFYLKSSVKLGGTGTESDPYYLID